MDFALLKAHPLVTGGVIIGGGLGLFLYWRSGNKSQPVTPQGTTMIYGGASGGSSQGDTSAALSAAVANNKISAEYDLGLKQIQAERDILLAQVDAQKFGYSEATNQKALDTNQNITIAGIASQTSIATNTNNNETAVQLATIQANAAVAINQQNTEAATSINASDNATSIAVAGIAGQVASQQSSDAVAIATQNNATAQAGIEAMQSLYSQQIQADENVRIEYLNTLETINHERMVVANGIAAMLPSGVFNKGGEGGANQLGVVSAILNQPEIGVAAQQYLSQNAQANGIGSILSGIGGITNAVL